MRPALVASGGVLTACVLAWALRGDQTAAIPAHLVLWGLAFSAYLVALRASRGLSRRGLTAALGVALLWRAALVATSPLLSDDVNRYAWEGRIQLHGGNPYAWRDRPESERWVWLRDAVWQGVNHKDYTAVYPPLWQMAARAVVFVHDGVTAMKVFVVACELAATLVLARLLLRRGLPRERLLILAWSPLALVEIAGSGHNEPFGIVLLALALLALEAGRPLLSALAGALAFQAKLVPALLMAAWVRRYRLSHLLAAGLLAALLVLPYASAGPGLSRSLWSYGQYWRFNETLFVPLEWLAGSLLAPRLAAFMVLALALGLAVARVEPVAAGLATTVGLLLLSPSVLPWYALWLLPWLVLRDAPGALLFTGTVGLAYLVYPGWRAGGPWQVSAPLRVLEYGPCLALAAVSFLRRRAA